MADNAFVKIGTALLKHQVKKLVGEETLGVLSEELADIGGDKLDAWLGDKSTVEEIEKAAQSAQSCFREKVADNELQQWMVSLPLVNLPKVIEAIDELPSSPNESKLENALRESIALNWKRLSHEQVDNAVNSFLSCLRSALLPIEKQTLMVIGRSVLRIEEKINQLAKLVEQLKPYSTEEQAESRFGNINVGGNVENSVVISGSNNVVYYYADGEKREMRTGWFFGHRYGDLAAFTGRADELKMLNEWLANKTESLLIVNAFGGFGKSALTWHWLNNNVDKAAWQTAIWWSFYEKESGFDSFLAEALTHLGMETKERSARQQVNDLLDAMQKTNILIVMDGFERLLRQYARMDAALQDDNEDAEIDPSQRDCTSQSAEVFLRGLSDKKMISKVLMTSRLLPRALESKDGKLQKGCREVNLQGFSPDDAVTYFHNEGIKATRAEIVAVCSAYGYHPLSLSLLVGLINEDHEHRGDIVVARNLDIFGDIKAKRDHVLKRAYESLAPERRDLLSKISCFRGSMEYSVIKKVFPSPDLDKALLDLRKRGLLQYTGETQRYDMHPIVRHYAYDNFTDEKRRKEAHVELAMHFIDVMPVTNKNVKTLEDLAPVIELYHHMVRAGNLDEARKIFHDRLDTPTYYQFGAYQLQIELLRALFLDGEEKLPRLIGEDTKVNTLSDLALAYSASGQPRRAAPLYEMHNALQEKGISNPGSFSVNEWKRDFAIGLGNVATQQLVIGALRVAERNLRHAIELDKELERAIDEADDRRNLGHTLSYRGLWEEVEGEFQTSQRLFERGSEVQGLSLLWSCRALHFLLMARFNPQSSSVNCKLAIQCAQHALELADKTAKIQYPYPRDYVDAYHFLGAAYGMNDELTLAEENLSKALNLCRQINAVDAEADILLDIARLRYDQKNYYEAKSLADEALLITERCGYVLQGADVNLFLAQYGLEQEKDKAKAKEYAETALKLATCDGPPYYYKVAYEEAERFLAQLKE